MKNLAPWVTSAVLTLGLVSMFLYFQDVIKGKDSEIQALTQKYNLLAADANAKIATANTQLQRLAAEANEKLVAANQPEVSVLVSFRKAFFASGDIAVIKNISSQPIPVSLTVNRSSTGQQKQFELVFDGGQFKEIGEREGWAFLPGDTIQVSQPGHKSLTVTLTN
jgi:hypothetical protein